MAVLVLQAENKERELSKLEIETEVKSSEIATLDTKLKKLEIEASNLREKCLKSDAEIERLDNEVQDKEIDLRNATELLESLQTKLSERKHV